MHTLKNVDCSFTRYYTLVDEAAKLPTIRSNEWPDVASYYNRNCWCFYSIIHEESPEFRSAEPILIRLHPYAT